MGKKIFRDSIFGDISKDEFYDWFYADGDVEKIIGSDNYFLLIDGQSTVRLAELLLNVYFESFGGDIYHERACDIARLMISGGVPLEKGCKLLADLGADNLGGVSRVFMAYHDEIESLGLDVAIGFYGERILADAKRILNSA